MKEYSRIILVGLKHTGKSTLGRLLAEKRACRFFDTDETILQLSGKTPRALYEAGGTTLLAEWETTACRYLADMEPGTDCVIATGGGLADNAEALKICKKTGLCVYIDTPADILFERISESAKRDGQFPPFLRGPNPKTQFLELFARRSLRYASIADVHIQAGTKRPLELAREITDYIAYGRSTGSQGRKQD